MLKVSLKVDVPNEDAVIAAYRNNLAVVVTKPDHVDRRAVAMSFAEALQCLQVPYA
jgi:hypothetical protein